MSSTNDSFIPRCEPWIEPDTVVFKVTRYAVFDGVDTRRAYGTPHYRYAVTTWLQLRGQPIVIRSAATVGDIVRYDDARTKMRLTAALALAVAFWIAVIGAEWGLSGTDVPSTHGAHALATAPHAEFAVITEHPHLQDGSTPVLADTFAHAVLSRATTFLAALGLIAATATLAAFWRQAPLATVRGPPRPLAGVLTGRLLLTRLCITRR